MHLFLERINYSKKNRTEQNGDLIPNFNSQSYLCLHLLPFLEVKKDFQGNKCQYDEGTFIKMALGTLLLLKVTQQIGCKSYVKI